MIRWLPSACSRWLRGIALLTGIGVGSAPAHAAPTGTSSSASRAEAAWQLTGPNHVSARDVRALELDLLAPGGSGPDDLLLAANVGRLELLESTSRDRHRVRFHLPEETVPRVALLAALDLKTGQLATHRIDIWGNPSVEIRSEPEVWIRAQVGSAIFGPVLTDKKGHAQLEIVVPPGSREVATTATDQRGNVTRQALALDPPPFSRLLALCSPREPAVYVMAADEDASAAERAAFSVQIGEATARPARRSKRGLFRVDLTRELAAGSEIIEARVALDGESQTCTMPRPERWAPAPEPQPEPAAAPAAPVRMLVGAQLGASSNFGKVAGPWGALHVAVPLGHHESGLRLEAQAGFSHSQSSGQTERGDAFDLTLDSLPVLGGVRYALAFGRWQGSAAASLGWAWVNARVEQGSSRETLSSQPLWLGGALRGAYLLPTGEAGLELGYSLLRVNDRAIQGNAAGLRATLGYLFHL